MRRLAALCGAGLLAALVAVAASACDEAEAPVGPPRCEPAEELVLERKLKEGFRALLEEQPEAARAAFMAVIRLVPGHPEAALGVRWVSGGIRPAKPAPAPAPAGTLMRLGEAVPVDVVVEHERYRFEEFKQLRVLLRGRDLDPGKVPLYDYFRARQLTPPLDAADPKTMGTRLMERLDLIVLHDTHTQTAREAFVQSLASGASSHFVIDWDGTVYQLLDLSLEANHAQRTDVDARSIAIDLVNPVELESPPLPPEAAEHQPKVERPLSDFVRLQRGEEIQRWGYTAPQMASLTTLVRALGGLCPNLPLRMPKDDKGAIPRGVWSELAGFRGIVGHVHVSPRAFDPGPGFDWEALERSLK